jgi:hypothetical protein
MKRSKVKEHVPLDRSFTVLAAHSFERQLQLEVNSIQLTSPRINYGICPEHIIGLGVRAGDRLQAGPIQNSDLEFGQLKGPFIPAPYQGYFQLKARKFKKNRYADRNESWRYYVEHVAMCRLIGKRFGDLFTAFDRQIVLPGTVALGRHPISHWELEAKGWLGRDNDQLLPEEAFSAVISEYITVSKSPKAIEKRLAATKKIGLPRGKNIGYPIPIGGRDRALNDFLLTLFAVLVQRCKNEGLSLENLMDVLANYHGLPVLTLGSRFQTKEGAIPLYYQDLQYEATCGFEPRHRGIYMSGKAMVIWERPAVKQTLAVFLCSIWHSQDRPTLRRDIAAWKTKGFHRFSVDVSKFDQRFGGPAGKQACWALARVIAGCTGGDAKSIFDNIYAEMSQPIVSFFKDKIVARTDAPILPSGVGTTTLINCIVNRTLAVLCAAGVMQCSFEEAIKRYQKDWDHRGWGDDMLMAFDAKYGTHAEVLIKIKTVFAAYRVKVDEEPAIKYLGDIYDRGSFVGSITLGHGLGRWVQTNFFPERKKLGPVGIIGYCARTLLLGADAQEIHSRMRDIWPMDLGDYFKYSEIQDVMAINVKKLETYSGNISEIDNLIMNLTDGSGDITQVEGIDHDLLEDLLSMSDLDVTDLDQTIADLDVVALSELKPLLTKLLRSTGPVSTDYYNVVIALSSLRKLTLVPGQMMY